MRVITMKCKHTLWLTLLLAAAAWADSPAQIELRSAQKAYQAALSAQSNIQGRADAAQLQLQTAQTQLKVAQDNVTTLQDNFNQIDVERQQADAALQAAGARLDAAWQAARPAE
ncbi:hypothetical protein PT286_09275 [Neisseriaceae bacterium ESL0693]|nr:hypothetical protein [Neisseriaceae bacterium ESL0693]